jgi:MFS family permease
MRNSPNEVAAEKRPRVYYGWVIVGAAFAAWFMTVGAQTGVIGAFAKPMADALGWSRTEFFLAETVGQLSMAVLGFALGPYVDRFGARRMMLIGITIMVPALVLISQVETLWQWVLLRGVLFVAGAALVSSLVVTVTVSKWFVVQRGRALGTTSMGVSLAGVVWPPLATLSISVLGWRDAWLVVAAAALVVLLPAALLMRRRPEDYGLQPDGVIGEGSPEARAVAAADYRNSFTRGEAVRTSTFYLIVLTFGISVVGIFAILTQTIPFLTDNGFSSGTAALMSSTMSIAAMVTKAPWGWTLEKSSSRILASMSFVIAAVGFVVVVIAANAGSIPGVAAGFVLTGTGIGGNIPIQEVMWAEYFGRRHLGAVRSLGFPFTAAIGAATPIGLAAYFDAVGNYDGALYGCAALWLAASVIILALKRPTKPGQGGLSGASSEIARMQPQKMR